MGSAPDSWGVWFAHDARQIPFARFLDELSSAGYRWLELGPYGYLPTDAEVLVHELTTRGLRVSGGTVAGALHRADRWPDLVAECRSVAAITVAAGAQHVVFLPSMYRDIVGAYVDEPHLAPDVWRTMCERAAELGKIVLEEHGVRLCVHPHADSHIETQAEIERFLDGTDSRYVHLCLDTGHVAYGAGDALDLIRRFGERIAYVHVKQIDPAVLAQVRDEQLAFAEAVRRGLCVEPPAGVPDTAAVVRELSGLGKQLFVIAEHDLYPCDPDVPLPIARRTRAYLTACMSAPRRAPVRGRSPEHEAHT